MAVNFTTKYTPCILEKDYNRKVKKEYPTIITPSYRGLMWWNLLPGLVIALGIMILIIRGIM